jgi:predicted amino acid racemase
MYPKVIINLEELKENCLLMKKLAKENGIDIIMPIVKVACGDEKVAAIFSECGFKYLGDSRIQNLRKFVKFNIKKMLVRLPMLSEIHEVILYSDLSLNSEIKTIIALDLEAERQNKKHEIIFMYDLGDLREGTFYKENYLSEIIEILKLKNIVLKGIGTNLTCYGGLVPSKKILNRLVDIKNTIKEKFNLQLDIISGGNSSSVFLFGKNEIPKEINSLRIGEAIFFGKETAYSTNIQGFNHDIFALEAEIIECKIKPSYPDGDISINSFGEKVEIEDKGIMKRAILAIGKQDVIVANIRPFDNRINIIGASSDHLILDVSNTDYQVGDIIKFKLNYPGLLHLMNSPYISKEYK